MLARARDCASLQRRDRRARALWGREVPLADVAGAVTGRGERVRQGMAALRQGDGIAPALIGSSFFFRWSDLSVGDMYTAIRTTMPQGAPASLSPSGYADISAFLLQKNQVPSGAEELPSEMDDLEAITITEAQ